MIGTCGLVLMRTVAITVITISLMCIAKVSMSGSLAPRCYIFLLEMCRDDCWRTNPSSHFPLECSEERDVFFMVLVNMGLFALSAIVAGLTVLLCGKLVCGRRRRSDDLQEHLIGSELRKQQKQQERDDMESIGF